MEDVQLISHEDLSAAAAYHVGVARVAGFDRALGDAATLERNALLAGVERRSYVDDLLGRRADALTKLTDQHVLTQHDRVSPWWNSDHVGDAVKLLTDGWVPTRVPQPHEGFCQPPGVEGTSGEIHTSSLARGTVVYGGTVSNDRGVGPGDEQYWVCNWSYTVVFPPAPDDGYLSYRFGVDSRVFAYHASALSGGIYAWVRWGVTGNSTLPFTNWQDRWPVNVGLPFAAGQSPFLGRDVPVSGSIQVHKGARPALGLIFGVIVGLASGSVFLLETDTSFVTHKVAPYTLPADLGWIEYRYDDNLLWKYLTNRISLEHKRLP